MGRCNEYACRARAGVTALASAHHECSLRCGGLGRAAILPRLRRASSPPVPNPQVHRVLNSMDAGRRLAKRAIVAQAIATLVLALALLLISPTHALGALLGGGGLVLGNTAMAWLGLRSNAPAADYAMGQLILGLLAKWVLVGLVLAVGILILNLPGPAVLAGLFVSMVVFFAFGSRVRH